MNKPTVAYATFCCAKDRRRALDNAAEHYQSHRYAFKNRIMLFQRCEPDLLGPSICATEIKEEDYPTILGAYGIKYPDPVLDELTHGWGAPHFWAHHMVNHLRAAQLASADYIVFADADCYMKDQPENESWVDKAIGLLELNPHIFVVSPNDGGDERPERIMSQQMFIVNRAKFMAMDFIPWDGTKIEGGPFQEYYGLLEGWIHRHMEKNHLCRYVLPPNFRYWHKEWH